MPLTSVFLGCMAGPPNVRRQVHVFVSAAVPCALQAAISDISAGLQRATPSPSTKRSTRSLAVKSPSERRAGLENLQTPKPKLLSMTLRLIAPQPFILLHAFRSELAFHWKSFAVEHACLEVFRQDADSVHSALGCTFCVRPLSSLFCIWLTRTRSRRAEVV